MILIGENINIMSKTLGPAIKEKKAKPIEEVAVLMSGTGVHYLDMNIGPARKGGDEIMEWLVKTVQGVVDLPLCLDTTNPLALEAGLKVHKGKAIINSVSLQPERLDSTLPLAQKYNANIIALLWGKEGMPRDSAERATFAVDLVYKANELGIPNEDIWIDPIVTPVSGEINQVLACTEFMAMLPDIFPDCKTVVGLSNVSNGTPNSLRPILNQTYLMMLKGLGLYSAIVDAFDDQLIGLSQDKKPQITSLIERLGAGEEIPPASLSGEELNYYKTCRVLMGKNLYSHSWLEL